MDFPKSTPPPFFYFLKTVLLSTKSKEETAKSKGTRRSRVHHTYVIRISTVVRRHREFLKSEKKTFFCQGSTTTPD